MGGNALRLWPDGGDCCRGLPTFAASRSIRQSLGLCWSVVPNGGDRVMKLGQACRGSLAWETRGLGDTHACRLLCLCRSLRGAVRRVWHTADER